MIARVDGLGQSSSSSSLTVSCEKEELPGGRNLQSTLLGSLGLRDRGRIRDLESPETLKCSRVLGEETAIGFP